MARTISSGLTPLVLGAALAVPTIASAQTQGMPVATEPQVEQQQREADRDRDGDLDLDGDFANRSPDDRLADAVAFRLETHEELRRYDIDVDVDGSVVTLSGEVASESQKRQALELADVDGVTAVEDDIEVDPDADDAIADRASRGLSKAGETIDDAWITTKVNWFFMGEDALEGSDIDVDTENNVVTLQGTVESEAGRRRALELARMTEGVREVRDQLTIAPER